MLALFDVKLSCLSFILDLLLLLDFTEFPYDGRRAKFTPRTEF